MEQPVSNRRQQKLQSKKNRHDEPYNGKHIRLRENIIIHSKKIDNSNPK